MKEESCVFMVRKERTGSRFERHVWPAVCRRCGREMPDDLKALEEPCARNSVTKRAREQGYHAGSQQALADAIRDVTEVLRAISEAPGVDCYQARVESLQHVRALLRARMKGRK